MATAQSRVMGSIRWHKTARGWESDRFSVPGYTVWFVAQRAYNGFDAWQYYEKVGGASGSNWMIGPATLTDVGREAEKWLERDLRGNPRRNPRTRRNPRSRRLRWTWHGVGTPRRRVSSRSGTLREYRAASVVYPRRVEYRLQLLPGGGYRATMMDGGVYPPTYYDLGTAPTLPKAKALAQVVDDRLEV